MSEPQTEFPRFGWPKWLSALLAALVVLYAVSGLYIMVLRALVYVEVLPDTQEIGIESRREPGAPMGWFRLVSVEPGKAMANAGARAGDMVRYDDPFERMRWDMPGDTIGLTIERDGVRRHSTLTFLEDPPKALDSSTLSARIGFMASTLGGILMALLILWRRWRLPAPTCLGLLMLGINAPSGIIPPWTDSQFIDFCFALVSLFGDGSVLLIVPFAYYLSGNPADRAQRRLVWRGFAVLATVAMTAEVSLILGVNVPIIGSMRLVLLACLGSAMAAAIALLARNYRRNGPEQRNRIKILGLAFSCYLLVLMLLVAEGMNFLPEAQSVALRWVAILLLCSSVLLVGYAMIRGGLFDFSFAVNRTLVYGAVSLALLCGFGLAEWAVDHLVPEEWHRAGPIFSAGIALALFLTFHRLRDFVEHHVEQLFFSSWHRNEEKLRQFIASTPHYEQAGKLASAAVAEFRRYSGGATAAIFWREEANAFSRLAGDRISPKGSVDPDDGALVKARTAQGAVRAGGTGSALVADLVLPIRDHGEMIGFIALGAKPHSLGYRPDEVEALGWAAGQVGLNLHSLRTRALRDRARKLEGRVADLENILTRLTPPAPLGSAT